MSRAQDLLADAAGYLGMPQLASRDPNLPWSEFGIDSLAMAELVSWMEDVHGIYIDDDLLESCDTPAALLERAFT